MVESDVALVELIPCAALLYSGAGTILAVNWMFCELVGYMPDELEHHHIGELSTGGERQVDDAVWLTTLVTKTGDTIECEVARKCLNGSGPLQCLALMRKFEPRNDSSRPRGEDFLALLAHELRNPLAPIRTAVQLLKKEGSNPEYVRRSSEIIERQVKLLSGLADSLMDVSLVTRGQVPIEKDDVSVADVVGGAVEQSRSLIESRKQQLVLRLSDEGARLLGDRSRLVQVLANLLDNAAQSTQQGGRITLTAEIRGGQAVISVTDNGMGMDAELLPRVFELFALAQPTPERHGGGLGLGLALSKSIVALHGGHIGAASAGRGKGSTFTVTLPLHHGASRPLHILLVDRADDGDELLPAALEAEGHLVALCPDEPSALETARDLHPDAVLIRTDMPGVEGYALARQLRALHPGEHATFIALSDSDQPDDKINARGAGFDHLLERPFAMGSLRRILP